MSTPTAPGGIGRPLDDPASLGRAVDELLAARAEPPVLLGLGEPAHGVEAFPLLRNDLLRRLVERGFRSVALEIDIFAASLVDGYVNGEPGDLDTVLETGFSHGFGSIPGNRELVEWLRAHNAGRPPRDRVRFLGFDAPLETYSAPSPRRSLTAVHDYLPATLRPESARDLEALLGDDADWTNQAAVFDPAQSIGDSDRARALRIAADDLASALRRAAPDLRAADPTGYDGALAHARTARGLLRYQATLASSAPGRVGTLFSLRTEMMAENLLAIREQEQHRGPTLVFAHNEHLRRRRSGAPVGRDDVRGGNTDAAVSWGSAGALVDLTLGERYMFVATDTGLDSNPGTLQHELKEATTRRALFPAPTLRAALPPTIGTAEPIVRGHIPLTPEDLTSTDAVIFVADTDGKQHQYW
ncbi:erythromycin esterase-like protein [Nocardia transvalensis]|uniref:Erythromycin esterase-like protein n=1 Tax=Nocardia transvalensis TaxID=37333 RepID=A0A7W9PCS8_9NOCA|nr:erythromycin esterase family protein [Nocardia transvalensis]MBB5913585.1 erythromycin esterase-like protein [Nocardia transvalensis]